MPTVARDVVLAGQVFDQLRTCPVHSRRERRTVGGVADVLDTDAVHVVPPVARVPGHVAVGHYLVDGAVLVDDVLDAQVLGGILEFGDRRRQRSFGVVDDDRIDRHRGRPIRQIVVAVIGDITVVGTVCRRNDDAVDRYRTLGCPRSGWC